MGAVVVRRLAAWEAACAMKVTAGIFAPATDQSIKRGLSMSISVRTRKMVNYAWLGQSQGCLAALPGPTIKDANVYPWSIQSLGSFFGVISSKLLTSLVQSIIMYLEFPCFQNLRVHVSKGTCSHDQNKRVRTHNFNTRPRRESPPGRGARKGTNGVSTNRVTETDISCFLAGTFWVLPLTYFYLPKSARGPSSPIYKNSLLLQWPH